MLNRFFNKLPKSWLLPGLALILILLLYSAGVFDGISKGLLSREYRLLRESRASDLVIVEADAKSLSELSIWPWPRSYHGEVLHHIVGAGARSVFFDIDFSSPSTVTEDTAFAMALATVPRNMVLLPTFAQRNTSAFNSPFAVTMPRASFAQSTGLASVNLFPERDGLVWRAPLREQRLGQQLSPAGVWMTDVSVELGESMLIDYRIDPSSFQRLSFSDVLRGNFAADVFKGKRVIIGATAVELGDVTPTPAYRALPGPVVQALIYQTLVDGRLRELGRGSVALALLVVLVLLVPLFNRASWRVGVMLCALSALVALAISVWMLAAGVVFEAAPVAIGVVLSFIATQLSRIDSQMLRILRQRVKLGDQDKLMSSIVANTDEGILTVDRAGQVQSINPGAEDIFGCVHDTLGDKLEINDLLPALDWDNREQLYGLTVEQDGQHRDSGHFHAEFSINPLRLSDQQLTVLCVRDISERIQRQKQLEYQASHDSLTGLYNRDALNQRIAEYLRDYATDHTPIFLMLIDLDRFKEVNDTLGHGAGDDILRALGERLVEAFGDSALIARLGGDEFGVLVRDARGLVVAVEFAKRILGVIGKPYEVDALSLELQASVGIAQYLEHAESTEKLMMCADIAMYQAKAERTGYAVYDEGLDTNTERKLLISSQLNQAVAAGDLSLYYQPKVDLKTNQVASFEALIRWFHPTLGRVPPDDFITMAERAGIIKPLTLFAIREGMAQSLRFQEMGLQISVAVNLSAFLLQDSSLIEDLAEIIHESPLEPRWISLEVTESAIVHDLDRAVETLNRIKDLGISLSIDDFGTGYASLTYIKQLPASELKLDQLFIKDVEASASDRIIVESTIELSHSLGLKVVAEGVEEFAIYNYLASVGCDMAQGYWISKPMPEDEIAAWLVEWEQRVSTELKLALPA